MENTNNKEKLSANTFMKLFYGFYLGYLKVCVIILCCFYGITTIFWTNCWDLCNVNCPPDFKSIKSAKSERMRVARFFDVEQWLNDWLLCACARTLRSVAQFCARARAPSSHLVISARRHRFMACVQDLSVQMYISWKNLVASLNAKLKDGL